MGVSPDALLYPAAGNWLGPMNKQSALTLRYTRMALTLDTFRSAGYSQEGLSLDWRPL